MTKISNSYNQVLEIPTDFRMHLVNKCIEEEEKTQQKIEEQKNKLQTKNVSVNRKH